MKKNQFVAAAALALAAMSAQAVTPLWLRDVKISPDGKEIAFSYKGDIYKVSTNGGSAQRLTTNAAYDSHPVWSADGKKIAFASDRNGGQDVFVMEAAGGPAKQITFNSAFEFPEAFSPDGQYVYYSASILDPASSAVFPTGTMKELYKVPAAGGRSEQVLATPAVEISFMPDGKSFVYQDIKGLEDTWRKHHTSSVTRDIWLYDATTGTHRNITNRPGEDLSPVVGADGSTLYYLSEPVGGSLNVYARDINNTTAQPTALTSFSTHPVRFLSQGADGTLAFTWDGEIYTLAKGATSPTKVAIDVITDDTPATKRLSVNGAEESAISPDGKQLAFTYRGEVFVTSVEYPSTKQITHTPEAESDISWGKDSRELYYTSERDGHYNIYVATIERKDDPNFSNATLINERPVFANDGVDRTFPMLSPDGKKLAFILDRNKLMVMDLKSKEVKQITDQSTSASRTKGYTVHWSPDSRWIAFEYTEPHHYPYSDIAVANVETGKVTKVTETGYFDYEPRWAMDGQALIFQSERYGMRNHGSWGSQFDIMITFLTQDAYDRYRLNEEDYALLKEVEKASKKDKKDTPADDKKGKKKSKKDKTKEEPAEKPSVVELELTDLADRTVRLTPVSSSISDAIITKDGQTLYYLSAFEGGYDMWKTDLRKDDTHIVKKLDGAGMGLTMDNDGNIYLLGRRPQKFDPKSEKFKSINISTSMEFDPEKEREYMYNFVENEARERFYVPDMGGVDWKMYCDEYAKFLPHINNNYDFANLLSELLGELNVSHSGGHYNGTYAQKPTASLGLLYDMTYTGPGLKVDEVVAKGPFDRATSKMKAGAVITAINGVEITDSIEPLSLLNNTSGKKTLVKFMPTGSGASVEEVVLPISSGSFNSLLYRRWVQARQAEVDSLSGGRLGYVHIQAMDDASFRAIYSDLLGKYIDREGIVIDTRWNGGGRLHEDIEVMFSGKAYLTQDVHGVPTSDMPSRRWNKPSIMIMGEANYSNAHGTPWVYKHLGLGKLVGMPVPGTMSSVNWIRLQDSSVVFGVPVVGFRTAEGNYLENTQLEPDIYVANDPAVIVTGRDQQIEVAVKELLNQLDRK